MDVFNLVATALVAGGALIMLAALAPVRALMAKLPASALRRRWLVMAALIGLFLAGYAGYAVAFWNRHVQWLDLIVPVVFFGGAVFVWLTARLSLQTALDMLRISRLEREIVTDVLTGVYNRRYLDARLTDELARARRYGFALAVVFVDIDHFKRINDNHGHPAGDQVLKDVAATVAVALRKTDVLARYGGEEFVIMSPHTDLPGAALVAERLLEAVRGRTFDLPGKDDALRITCSAGVAALSQDMADVHALLDAADKNLYRAKRLGRDRVVAGPVQAGG